MKSMLTVLAFAFTASALPSYADSDHADAPKSPLSYVVQSDHQTVAILPANPARTMAVTSDTATFDRTTGTSTFSGGVKIVVSAPGQTPVTIAGNELTLIAQR